MPALTTTTTTTQEPIMSFSFPFLVPMQSLVRAMRSGDAASAALHRFVPHSSRNSQRYIHTDTPRRASMRAILDHAGAAGATVLLAFYKDDESLRYIRCRPVPRADATACYVTVQDLCKSDEAGRAVYRRVRLDTIAQMQIDWTA